MHIRSRKFVRNILLGFSICSISIPTSELDAGKTTVAINRQDTTKCLYGVMVSRMPSKLELRVQVPLSTL